MLRYDNPVMIFMEALFDYVLLSLLWVLGSLPIVTIGLSTCAFFRAGYLRKSQPGCGILKTFFRAYRDNFRQGMLLSAPLALCTGALGLLLIQAFFSQGPLSSPAVRLLCLISGLCLFVLFSHGFSLMALFENNLQQTLYNAIGLAIAHPVRTILAFALALLTGWGILLFLPMAFFILPIHCWLQIAVLWPVYRQHLESDSSPD